MVRRERIIELLEPKSFKRIHFWGKVAGILTILYGVLKIFQSLSSIAGPISGILSILLGICLYKSGEAAKYFLKSDRQDVVHLNQFLNYYGLFLLISGLLLIIMVLVYIVFFVLIID